MNELDTFRRAVNKHFAFLCQRGFSEPKESSLSNWDLFLEFSSSSVSILVLYGPPDCHVDLCFWRIFAPENRFGLGDLLAVGQQPELWRAEIGTTGIEREVTWLASAVHSVEEPLCSGDIGFYETLTTARYARITEWKRKEELSLLQGKVEHAWKEKNWAEVVFLYNSIRTELTVLEEKRLIYAEKKLKAAT